MGSLLVGVPLGVILAVAVTVVAVVAPGRRRVPAADQASHPGLGRLRAVSLVMRVATVVVGAALVALACGLGGLGRGVMLAPVLFGGCQVLGVLVADALTRGAARSPGVAALEHRRSRDLLPGRLARVVGGAALVLVGLLTWTTLVASADDQGRAGRALGYRCVAECDHALVSPWPGSYYSLPLAIGLLIVGLLTLLTLGQTARRPRNGADPEVLRVDGAIRRRAAESVVAGAGVAVTGSLAGIATTVGARLLDAEQAPVSLSAAMWPALFIALAAVAGVLWCLAVLLLPGPSPDLTPTRPAPAARGAGGSR